jgi:hypothetical protein
MQVDSMQMGPLAFVEEEQKTGMRLTAGFRSLEMSFREGRNRGSLHYPFDALRLLRVRSWINFVAGAAPIVEVKVLKRRGF